MVQITELSPNDEMVPPLPQRKRLSTLRRMMVPLQLVGFICFMLVYSISLCCTIPLRILHRPLRLLGVPSNYLPLDYVTCFFAKTFLLFCGVDVMVEGSENVDQKNPVIGLYQHVSNLDPFLIMGYSGIVFKLVAKKSVYRIPLFGWAGLGFGHIAIDRGNRERAIASLDYAEYFCRRWNRSILIAPEGTRSKSGELQMFKKGPFHVVRHLKIKMTPIVLFNAWTLWPPGQIFAEPGTIVLRVLPSIPFDDKVEMTDQMKQVRDAMAQTLCKPPRPQDVQRFNKSRWWFRPAHYTLVTFWVLSPVLAYLYLCRAA